MEKRHKGGIEGGRGMIHSFVGFVWLCWLVMNREGPLGHHILSGIFSLHKNFLSLLFFSSDWSGHSFGPGFHNHEISRGSVIFYQKIRSHRVWTPGANGKAINVSKLWTLHWLPIPQQYSYLESYIECCLWVYFSFSSIPLLASAILLQLFLSMCK